MQLSNMKNNQGNGRAASFTQFSALHDSRKSASESLDPVSVANVTEISEQNLTKSVKLYDRRRNQLINREEKARQGPVLEEKTEYADLIASEKFDKESIDFFLRFRDTAVKEEEAKWRQQKQWMEYRLQEQTRRIVREEAAMRQKIVHQEISIWQTITYLHKIESKPLLLAMQLVQLVEAEKMRRAYIMHLEVSEALAMNIPNYMPVLISDGLLTSAQKKIDYLENERCPFMCQEECPYYPKKLVASNSADAETSDNNDSNIRFLRYSTLHKGHYKHHYNSSIAKINK